MKKLSKFMRRFFNNKLGATAIEYAIICTLIADVVILSAGTINSALNKTFTTIAGAMEGSGKSGTA